MYDDFDDYLDVEPEEHDDVPVPHDPGPEQDIAPSLQALVGRIATCDMVMWDGHWCVEVTLDDGTEEQLDLDEDELRWLADHEPKVAAECDVYSGPTDAQERAAERSQMGFSNF